MRSRTHEQSDSPCPPARHPPKLRKGPSVRYRTLDVNRFRVCFREPSADCSPHFHGLFGSRSDGPSASQVPYSGKYSSCIVSRIQLISNLYSFVCYVCLFVMARLPARPARPPAHKNFHMNSPSPHKVNRTFSYGKTVGLVASAESSAELPRIFRGAGTNTSL